MRKLSALLFLVFSLLHAPSFLLAQQTIDPRLLPAGVPRQIQIDGVNATGTDPLNIQQSTEIDPVDAGGGVVQWALRNASIADARIISITTRSKLPSALAYDDEANTWSGANTFGGAVSINGAGSFSISGSSSGTITIGRSAASGTYNFNLPTSAGSSGQPLLSGGGGGTAMSFATLGLAGGGTGATSFTANRCVRSNAGGTALEAAAADCGTGGGGAPDQTANYAWTGTHSFRDNNFSILDNADPTKIFQLNVANISPSTTRTFTVPNANTNLLGGSDIGSSIQAFDTNLNALSGAACTGFWVITSDGAGICRSFTVTTGEILLTPDGTGTAGNVTVGVGTNVLKDNRAATLGAFLYDFSGATVRIPMSASNLSLSNGLFGIQTTSQVVQVVVNGALRRVLLDGTDCTAGPVTYNSTSNPLGCGSYPSQTVVINPQTGTSYVVLDADRGRLVTLSNASPVAVTLPDPEGAGFDTDWYVYFHNRGAGTVTITPQTSQINGVATLVLPTGHGAMVASDGANYFTMHSDFSVRLAALATGILKSTTGTGAPSIAVAGTDYVTPTGSGAGLTALNATNLASGNVPLARNTTSVLDGSANGCTSAVGTDAYACTLPSAPSSYVTNATYGLIADVANSAAASVNYTGSGGPIGVRAIKKFVGGSKIDVATGDIVANQPLVLKYDGTDMIAVSLGGGGGGSGTVSGLVDECIPKAGSATLIDSCSALTEGASAITSTKDICIGDCSTNALVPDYSPVTGIKTLTYPNRSGSLPTVADNSVGALPLYWGGDLAAVIGGSASHVWNDDPLSTACTPTAVVGTNRGTAVCNFPTTAGAYGRQLTGWLPPGQTLGIDAFIWFKTTGTGNAIFQIATKCYGDNEADDATFNTATAITAAAGTSGRPNLVTQNGITATGCDPLDLIRIRFFRDSSHLSDTLDAALDVEKVIIRVRYTP